MRRMTCLNKKFITINITDDTIATIPDTFNITEDGVYLVYFDISGALETRTFTFSFPEANAVVNPAPLTALDMTQDGVALTESVLARVDATTDPYFIVSAHSSFTQPYAYWYMCVNNGIVYIIGENEFQPA